MKQDSVRKILFMLLLVACFLPQVGTATALIGGILFSLVLGNPWPRLTAAWSKKLLQVSVVGLGFGLSLATVVQVGAHSAVYTIVGIAATLAAGWALGRVVGTTPAQSLLISFGTAICGGSAIAAMAPVLRAEDDEVAVSLATVFTLNAVALLLFPLLGHLLGLSQQQFGLWAGLAIHDTSSVVGAAAVFGTTALAVGTTVKLTRALWIMPCVLMVSMVKRSEQRAPFPLFIVGFMAAAAAHTLLPPLEPVWSSLALAARQSLVATLFLIGAGLSREVLGRVGVRPLLQGLLLWMAVSGLTAVAILFGVIAPP
ncbi:YeiH family protein [Trichlorobacter ammonificans]|nr:putative sulfate exporter family transporter [Trichlorobacter ammonificans]